VIFLKPKDKACHIECHKWVNGQEIYAALALGYAVENEYHEESEERKEMQARLAAQIVYAATKQSSNGC